ncbi:HD-GYP domain-containing protein [Agarivorans sp. Toyoura001]|uniref:HD-GYP domain-containing protein n=1 Tax=unclassified Agarivorans TaxID=2636026 RepID=UPI0010F16D03|nr:two-component system response regulator [Agarivorans sp. Toyoura001]GDY26034.1 two-component system response regulator [Agarivorans sp. Toyoura001]
MENRATVLIVDDTPENIDVLAGILREDYKIQVARNGDMALKIVSKANKPDLILLDIMMPGIDGFEVCRRLKDDLTTRHIPVVFVTAKISPADELHGLELGAVDYITKPVSPPVVKVRVKTHLALFNQNRELDRKVKEQTDVINTTRLQIIQRLGRAAEYKDNETGLHVIRMSHYSKILGIAAGMSEPDAEVLMNAAPMHDIGKIGIPDSVLQKPGKLDADEWDIMQSHAVIGGEILGEGDSSELLDLAKTVALTHHEKWDGSGYPNGLAGEDIPIVGRIVAIADVFDALTSQRPYKQAWPVEKAVDLLKSEAGTHFDPTLVPLFIAALPEILEIKAKFEENQD